MVDCSFNALLAVLIRGCHPFQRVLEKTITDLSDGKAFRGMCNETGNLL